MLEDRGVQFLSLDHCVRAGVDVSTAQRCSAQPTIWPCRRPQQQIPTQRISENLQVELGKRTIVSRMCSRDSPLPSR